MRRFGILTVCLVAVFAASTVATATEELPEIGRCIKVAGLATHRYATATCTTRSEDENTGKFEWEPGPGPNSGFTGTAEASYLETVGKTTLKCSAGTVKGEFTGPRTDVATITFTGCEYGSPTGIVCQTPGARAGEVVTNALEGGIGYISGAGTTKPVVGMRLAPAAGTQFASVECSGVTVTLSGSVIGTIAGAIDKMTLTTSLKFKAAKGKQIPEQLEGGPTSVLNAAAGAEAEQAGLTTNEWNTNEEPIEVKAIG
ncbi:MAG TPA: hypothetical protein VNZ01_02075 [Solirubrobacteraceae bacterium]|jgi:hypothetical protein|nr:hypothetical protein [Solirubrobacteraceae bacterium]